MGLMLKTQRDGTLRDCWYGVYTETNGKRRIVNLNVKVRGIPPASFKVRDAGDEAFEKSRQEARLSLDKYVDEARRKGRADHLTERLIESKTGREVEYAKLDDLAQRWRSLGREAAPSEAYLKGCDAAFKRFVEFMATRNPKAVYLYEVTPEDAGAYVAALNEALARKTVRDNAKLLNKAFDRFLPVGAGNPFAGFVGRRTAGESEVVHRKPFSPDELQSLLDAARDDEFMYPLIVTAACSGMRRGDVCRLQWEAVDLKGGMLTVKTSKTGTAVEIPIFKPLLDVLRVRRGRGRGYVFADAARMLEENPDGLTWRFKKVVARAFQEEAEPEAPETVPAADVLAEGETAISEKIENEARRKRMLATFRLYCEGQSIRSIEKATGYSRGAISMDLHTIQDLIGKPFLRVQSASTKKAVRALTQEKRARGQRAASVRDWHALRATFVTLALTAGVPVELVRRVTGHATVEVVLKHYFRPDREQFRAVLANAMPAVLTGGTSKKTPAEELSELSAKLAAGTATDGDRTRLRDLAAAV